MDSIPVWFQFENFGNSGGTSSSSEFHSWIWRVGAFHLTLFQGIWCVLDVMVDTIIAKPDAVRDWWFLTAKINPHGSAKKECQSVFCMFVLWPISNIHFGHNSNLRGSGIVHNQDSKIVVVVEVVGVVPGGCEAGVSWWKKTHIRPESLYKSLWSTREAKKKNYVRPCEKRSSYTYLFRTQKPKFG